MKTALAASAGALALAVAIPAVAAAIPRAQHENGVTYVSGGIGSDEAAAMKSEAKHYPLSMVFSAGKRNEYLADVKVKVQDPAGKVVLDEVSGGPIMLVKVPAGRYEVVASRGGKTERRTVQVPAKGDREIAFHWSA